MGKCNFTMHLTAAANAHSISIYSFSYYRLTKKPFAIRCNSLILANGGSDIPNLLGVCGENKARSWVIYELPNLKESLERTTQLDNSNKRNLKPVMIVGAGLSAADAVIECRKANVDVFHVYRNVASGIVSQVSSYFLSLLFIFPFLQLQFALPQKYFPEYNEVFDMMRSSESVQYDFYHALPEFELKKMRTINGKHFVTVHSLRTGETRTIEVAYCAIFIGSRPDLSMLSNAKAQSEDAPATAAVLNQNNCNNNDNFIVKMLRKYLFWLKNICRNFDRQLCTGLNCQELPRGENRSSLLHDLYQSDASLNKLETDGLGFGEFPEKRVDCKNNVLAINKFTNELVGMPGIFALGPLVGDNFVRFIAGGALGILSALHHK